MDPKGVQEKSNLMRETFNLPEGEAVIQDFHCGVWRGLPYGWWQGRLFLSLNHILFRPKVGDYFIDVRLHDVEDVSCARSVLFFDTAMSVKVKGNAERLYFGTFVTTGHRNEAFAIAQHLLQYPVSFVTLPDEEVVAPPPPQPLTLALVPAPALSPGRSGDAIHRNSTALQPAPAAAAVANRASTAAPSGQTAQSFADLVDTKSSQRALDAAIRARETGTATLSEMQRQREVLARAETQLDTLPSQLDNANRSLRAIESVGGAFANRLSAPKPTGDVATVIAQAVQVRKVEKAVQIPIVHKLKDDSLVLASLRLFDEYFEIGREAWFLRDIDELVVRSRPLHLDVRFGTRRERVRFMSAQIQVCVNEFWLRNNKIVVIFEPGPLKPFKYGLERHQLQALQVVSAANPFQSRASVHGPSAFTASMKNTDAAAYDKLKQQDDHLDKLGDVVHDLKEIALAQGTAAEEDIATIRRITDKTEKSRLAIDATNARVQKLL